MTVLLICPQCASAKVDDVRVIGRDSDVACANCGWAGKRKDLLGVDAEKVKVDRGIIGLDGEATPLEIANEVSTAYMRLLAKQAGRFIGLALVQSGMVGIKDLRSLARLIKAACRGAHTATLDEVGKIQEEAQDARRSNAN